MQSITTKYLGPTLTTQCISGMVSLSTSSARTTEMSQEYNGWANHATWLVNLWLTNDKYTEEGLRMAVRYGGHEGLKDYVDELLNDSGIASGTMWYDMIRSCLDDVDWREIAGHCQDDEDEKDEPDCPEVC